jgi:hypothetical protein
MFPFLASDLNHGKKMTGMITMDTPKERIAHFTDNLQKVLASHGAASEHFVYAFFTLQGEIANVPQYALFDWAKAETERLHKLAVANISEPEARPLNKIELVSHVATMGALLKQSIINAISETNSQSQLVTGGVTELLAELNKLVQRPPVTVWEPVFSDWRHSGYYVSNLHYPDGGLGCVSNNYNDGKWRIVCDNRPFDERPTFGTREAAAHAEKALIDALSKEQ